MFKLWGLCSPFLRFSCQAEHVTCSIIKTRFTSNMCNWVAETRSGATLAMEGALLTVIKGCIQGKIQGLPLIPLFHHSPQSRGTLLECQAATSRGHKDLCHLQVDDQLKMNYVICACSFHLLPEKYLSLSP